MEHVYEAVNIINNTLLGLKLWGSLQTTGYPVHRVLLCNYIYAQHAGLLRLWQNVLYTVEV